MRKIQNIQALRGVAVFCVMLFHLVAIEQKYGGSETILPSLFQFGMFGVDLFFVISGFVMVTVTRGKFQIPKQALKFIYHRAARIYPVYWVYSALVLAVYLVQPAWVNSSQGNQVDILASFLLIPSDYLPLVMVGWTLIHEMYFYLIFFLIMLLVPENKMPFAVILWGVGVVLLNLSAVSAGPVVTLVAHPLTIEFLGGCILARTYFSKDCPFGFRALLVMTCLITVASLYGYHSYQDITGQLEPLSWWRVLIFGVPALFIVYFFVNSERSGHVIHSSLVDMGNASYSIYLSHVLTLSAVGRVWGMFSTDAVYDNYVMIPVLLILVIVVGFASYNFIEKPLLKLSRRIA